jgi:hypothetical protein
MGTQVANVLAAAVETSFESMSSRLLDAMMRLFQISMLLDYRRQARERVAAGSSDIESYFAEPTEKTTDQTRHNHQNVRKVTRRDKKKFETKGDKNFKSPFVAARSAAK